MEEKCDAKKEEHQLRLLAENRIRSSEYKIFAPNARLIARKKIGGRICLVVINDEGETRVITPEFEIVPGNALRY